MNLNITVNESGGESSPSGPRTKQVRAFFSGQQDAGHVSGPFTDAEAATAAVALLARGDVRNITIEEVA